MHFVLILLFAKALLFASDLNVDPQREDTYLQDEQTDDIQFEEDKFFRQERELGRV